MGEEEDRPAKRAMSMHMSLAPLLEAAESELGSEDDEEAAHAGEEEGPEMDFVVNALLSLAKAAIPQPCGHAAAAAVAGVVVGGKEGVAVSM